MRNPFIKLVSETSVEEPELALPQVPQTPEEIEARLAQLENWKQDILNRAESGEPEIDDEEQLEAINKEIESLRNQG